MGAKEFVKHLSEYGAKPLLEDILMKVGDCVLVWVYIWCNMV